MGLDTPAGLLLSAAKSIGVDFTDVMMIGRQFFQVRPRVLEQIFERFEISEDADAFRAKHEYAERFFELLGAARVESLDVSEYESAAHRYDLNYPIPAELHAPSSLVFDAGTLEHVFNIPEALRSCMAMVRLGGHFVQVNCANNFMGHGFWQFGPETIFRAFSAANGFAVKVVMLHEVKKKGRWVVVTDPAVAGSRVNLINSEQTYILTIAQRVSDLPIFEEFPQQSDYEPLWQQPHSPHGNVTQKKQSRTPLDRMKRLRNRLFPPPRSTPSVRPRSSIG